MIRTGRTSNSSTEECMQNKKDDKEQESIQSSTTPDPHEKVTKSLLDITKKSQEVSLFPTNKNFGFDIALGVTYSCNFYFVPVVKNVSSARMNEAHS